MNKSQKILAIVAVIAVVLAGSVGAYTLTRPSGSTQLKTIRVTLTGLPEATTLNVYYAKEILKEKYGIDLEFQYFEDTAMVMASIIGGSADITSESTGLFSAIASGAAVKVIGVDTKSSDYIIVAKDSITSLKGLEGKTVGISATLGMTHIFVLYPFKDAGGDPDKVNWLVVGSTGTRVKALVSGQIDASAVHLSDWKYLESLGGFRNLGTVSSFMPNYTGTYYGASQEFINNHPDLILAFTKAQIEANRLLNNNFTEYERLFRENLVEQPKIPLHDLWSFLSSIGIWPNNEAMNRDSVQYTIDLLLQIGTIKQNLAVDQAATFEFEQQALKDLGTV